jgi:hypothetical protein
MPQSVRGPSNKTASSSERPLGGTRDPSRHGRALLRSNSNFTMRAVTNRPLVSPRLSRLQDDLTLYHHSSRARKHVPAC